MNPPADLEKPEKMATPQATCEAIRRLAESAKARKRRSLRAFAESEIILPTGPYRDERFKAARLPWFGLWMDAIDSARWTRFALTGPSQAGKTLAGSALPVMYHLFECGETVIYAAPTLDMAADKWRQDILPVIRSSKYRDLLPAIGPGSRSGTATSIEFRHGPTLRFMTGGGGDKVRAGFTARVAVITECDGMDDAGQASREADKISQIEARTNAFGDTARLYLECTVSTETGRIWKEIQDGTASRIILPCPHCGKWVTPEREHLKGWQDARSISEASERAVLACPASGCVWSEEDRVLANRSARLIHKGQEVAEDGTIIGVMPRTNTFGFRVTASNNLLAPMSRVASEEWASPRRTEAELAEKKLRQFFWAMPSEPESVTLSAMDAAAICARTNELPRGRVPADATAITIGVDVGKWLCHWAAIAWRAGGTPHIIEYGRLEVPSGIMAEEQAILITLRRFRDEICKGGWPRIDSGANTVPSLTLVDSGNWEATIVAFSVESGPGFLPSKGFGISQLGGRRIAGEPGFEVRRQPAGHSLVEINADHWKSVVHARLQTPSGQPGGLTLFAGTANEHLTLAKHLTAEKKVEEFVAGRGLVTRWQAINRNNHYLDAVSMACAGGYGIGQRLDAVVVAAPQQPPTPPPVAGRERPEWMPDKPTGWTRK